MNNLTVEEILWLAIKDIEEGRASTIDEDPISGLLEGKNKKLTKMNVSHQSAKYTENNKPISRPTIDSYAEISDYLKSIRKEKSPDDFIIENLKSENDSLKVMIKQLNEQVNKLAQENYRLNHKNNLNVIK